MWRVDDCFIRGCLVIGCVDPMCQSLFSECVLFFPVIVFRLVIMDF